MKILLIDEDTDERLITKKTLLKRFPQSAIIEISGQEQFESHLTQTQFQLVISEYRLSWKNGIQLFKQIHDRYACIPFVMLTGSGNEELAVAAMKAGINDYLCKNNRQQLNEAVLHILSKTFSDHKLCQAQDNSPLLCEKWDLAISRLTSDFAYSMRVTEDDVPVFEWFTEPLKQYTRNNQSKLCYGLPVHPEDVENVHRHFETLLSGEEDTIEYRVSDEKGIIHFFKDHALPIRDWNEGKVVRIYGAIQDITQQRLAENKLHLMQYAMDSSNNGIIITDLKDRDYAIIYVNQAFVRMTGYTEDELIGRNPRFLQRDDNKQAGISMLRTALTDNRIVHTIIRNYRKDGSLFWNEVYISPVYNKHQRITHYIGVQNDVSQRVEMDKLIWNKEAKMRAIFNNVMDGIIITYNDAKIESMNPSAEAMFGYSLKSLLGKSVEHLLSIDQSHHRKINLHQLNDRPTEAWGITDKAVIFPVKIGLSKIYLEPHTLFILTIQNITDSKQAEDALRKLSSHLELAREEERTWIAREIHDELGSKLTALKMDFSWLTEKLCELPTSFQNKTMAMSQHIDDAIHTVQKIATDLRPSILDHLGLSAAIEWQVENFRQQSGLACELTTPEQDIIIDNQRATAVFRIIQESLTNISRHAQASQVIIDIFLKQNRLLLSISDNGNGMSALQMNNPEKFGIQGMHERARYFGGQLSIKSAPRQGCTVSLNLPNHT